jgi:rhodanese-related sulfurtransferase
MKNITHFLFIAFLIFILTNCGQPSQSLSFKLSPEEALQKAVTNDYLLSSQAFTKMTENASNDMVLIDLRSPSDFTNGHFPDAYNMPVAHLLDTENFDILKNSPNVILYGEGFTQTNGAWFLLTQLGLENVKILESGYDDLMANSETFSPEDARFNFADIFQKAVERHEQELEAGKPKPVIVKKKTIVPKKKKVEEEEEGC